MSALRSRYDLFTSVRSSIADLLGCKACGIAVFDSDNRTISFPAFRNQPITTKSFKIKLDTDIFSEVIHIGKTIRVDNYQSLSQRIPEFEDAGVKALAITPLKARGKTLALLWVASMITARRFSDYDMVLLESIGGQAAISIDNIDLFEEQRYISDVLQRGFLPEKLPIVKHTNIGIFYESATVSAVVSGDFYDFIPLNEDIIGLAVGDSSGKGVEATDDAAMTKYTMRSALVQNPSPASALTQSNIAAATQLTNGHFVTLFYGLLNSETGNLLIGLAGHPHPVYFSAVEQRAIEIGDNDPAFGIIRDYVFSETDLTLLLGDIFVVYTDGLIELRRDSDFFSTARVIGIVEENSGMSAQEIADSIIEAAREFSKGQFTDDIVLMVIKRTD